MSSSVNNGGSTDYYKLKRKWKDGMDIIEDRYMNYSQGNIFKVAMTFNIGRHDGTNYERELNKIIYFANRELERIKQIKILEDIPCDKVEKHGIDTNEHNKCICGSDLDKYKTCAALRDSNDPLIEC